MQHFRFFLGLNPGIRQHLLSMAASNGAAAAAAAAAQAASSPSSAAAAAAGSPSSSSSSSSKKEEEDSKSSPGGGLTSRYRVFKCIFYYFLYFVGNNSKVEPAQHFPKKSFRFSITSHP